MNPFSSFRGAPKARTRNPEAGMMIVLDSGFAGSARAPE